MQHQYEIHFVRQGKKETLRISHVGMSEMIALRIVTTDLGVCVGETLTLQTRDELIALAERLQINKVRWNRASHTISFAERAKLSMQSIPLMDITDE